MNDIETSSPYAPLFVYKQPMFALTVSCVILAENCVVVLELNEKDLKFRFPGGLVRAGHESVQFSIIRHVKEQTGLVLLRDKLIPIDYRSDPERSLEGNLVDIGMLYAIENIAVDDIVKLGKVNLRLLTLNFETARPDRPFDFYMDHDVLLERAIKVFLMMKDE